jgi:hypothetical protein
MKEALRVRRFSSGEEVSGAVQNLLNEQPKTFSFLHELKRTCETLEPVR